MQYIGKSSRDAKRVAKRAEKWDKVEEAFNKEKKAKGLAPWTLDRVISKALAPSKL